MVAEQSKLQGPSMSSASPTRKINNVYLRITIYLLYDQYNNKDEPIYNNHVPFYQ
jgi:hypothetical protein